MERAQLVKEYCKANSTPVQELCPEINQYFETKKGYEVWNSRTSVREVVYYNPTSWQSCRDHKIINTTTPRSEYEGFYVRYIEELDALEMARVWIKGNRGQNGEERYWSYRHDFYYIDSEDRLFIFHNDTNAYTYDGTKYEGGKYYSRFVITKLGDWMRRAFVSKENYTELKKFDSKANLYIDYYGNIRENDYIPQIWQYREWYRKDFFKRIPSKKTNDLLSYELDDVSFVKNGTDPNQIYFQQLNDECAVLRVYDYPSGWNYNTRKYESTSDNKTEKARLFIPAKGKPTLIVNEWDTWEVKGTAPWCAKRKAGIVNRADMENYPRLKYILPCINTDDCTLQSFINILRHPIIEQIYKAGYPNIAKALCANDTIGAELKEAFGVEKEKKIPMFKLLGVNKFVLQAAEKQNNCCLSVIKELKYFAGDFDATKLNEETCELIAQYVSVSTGWRTNSVTDIIYSDDGYWRQRYTTPLTDEQRKWIIRLLKMEKKREGCVRLYRDTIDTYKSIINKPEIDLYSVRNYAEIGRLHDALVTLQVQEQADRRRAYDERERRRAEENEKAFNKLQEDRIAKFEYENDEYCIRVPHELSEITKEGLWLHHCVGGYLDRHANGSTNIIFLRRKDAEEVPFYTIEIDGNDNVIQIHGYGNRWLGNNPEVVPFVYTYLNKIGAKYNKQLLLNKGTGYCASSDNLDDSYLKNIA